MSTAPVPTIGRVLVTGGAGFIGARVVRSLVEDGVRVRCLLRPSTDRARLEGLPIEARAGDVRDAAAVERAFAGCDAVVHLASLSAWNLIDSPLMEEVVQGGTRNVLGAVRAGGAGRNSAWPRVVFVSSAAAVSGSENPKVFDESTPFELERARLSYCVHKRAAERLCRESGLPVVIVNPGEVYGPGDTGLVTAGNLVDFANGRPVLVCAGGTSVAHVDDVAAGIKQALYRGRPGQRYLLGGDNLTVRQLAALTLSLLGRRRRILTLPRRPLRALARAALRLGLPLPFNPRVIPYATRYWYVDATKARRELGVAFRGAHEVLGPTLAWLRRTGRIA
jgi:dihydroflavonol-4-reductase